MVGVEDVALGKGPSVGVGQGQVTFRHLSPVLMSSFRCFGPETFEVTGSSLILWGGLER